MDWSKTPIVVMSFNRPHFLEQTLKSLREQVGFDPDRFDIHLFQDGAVNRWSRLRYAADADIEASVDLFRHAFPNGTVHHAGDNVGICENFYRAEDFVFVERQAETAWFFEDDMILSPAYFAMMDKLQRFAVRTPRLAYFAAYGDYYATIDEVKERERELILLDHHWAFGLRRSAWARMRKVLAGYYSIVRHNDYARRDHRAIYELFGASGMVPGGSSQDAAKAWACARLGLLRIRTMAPFARYIGTQGAHMTPELFNALRFNAAFSLDRTVDGLLLPDDNDVTALIEEQRSAFHSMSRSEYDAILARLPSREFNPMRKITADEVVAAYSLLLRRLPESDHIVKHHAGRTAVFNLVAGVLESQEFTVKAGINAGRLISMHELEQAYALLLHRALDRQAIDYGPVGKSDVASVVRRLLASAEYHTVVERLFQSA